MAMPYATEPSIDATDCGENHHVPACILIYHSSTPSKTPSPKIRSTTFMTIPGTVDKNQSRNRARASSCVLGLPGVEFCWPLHLPRPAITNPSHPIDAHQLQAMFFYPLGGRKGSPLHELFPSYILFAWCKCRRFSKKQKEIAMGIGPA